MITILTKTNRDCDFCHNQSSPTYRNGTYSCINRPNTHWKREIRVAKRNYYRWAKDPILFQWHGFSVEKALKDITNYKTPSPSAVENQQQGRRSEWVLLQVEKHHKHFQQPPSPPHLHSRSVKIMCARVFRKNKRRKAPGPDGVSPVLSETLCWPAGPHLHTDSSTDHWSCVKPLPASNAPPSSPSLRNPR